MQAGGKVTDFDGGDTFYSGHQVLASNGKLHNQLLEVVRMSKESC
jgi:myo-inositol-1(or 4)-monophosphatase